jgi:hypothetical protein
VEVLLHGVELRRLPDTSSRLHATSIRVDFEASESMPYLPRVDWSKFDDDEKYQRELAAGKYVPDRITIGGASYGVENMRQEWSRYQNFRPGLYRDGPSQEASRRINAKLLEYKEESWETNATIFDTRIPIAKAVTDYHIQDRLRGSYAGSNIPVTSHSLLSNRVRLYRDT